MNEVERAAQEAIDREEYDLALKLLRDPASAGLADAQYLLGYLYFTSADVDAAESKQWLERAAAQSHAEALFHLSHFFEDGTTGPPDTEDRAAMLTRAAELGSLQAQRDLGCYYAVGECGFAIDLSLARHWYSRAAERGHADAQYNYGLMLIEGEGGPPDPASGLEWVRRAVAQDDESALDFISHYF